MKKQSFLLLTIFLFLFAPCFATAQPAETLPARHSLHLTIGPFGLAHMIQTGYQTQFWHTSSLGYEFMITKRFAAWVDLSLLEAAPKNLFSPPGFDFFTINFIQKLYVTWILGQADHHLELGGGFITAVEIRSEDSRYLDGPGSICEPCEIPQRIQFHLGLPTARVAYRYQKQEGGVILRVAVVGPVAGRLFVGLQISIGYVFRSKK